MDTMNDKMVLNEIWDFLLNIRSGVPFQIVLDPEKKDRWLGWLKEHKKQPALITIDMSEKYDILIKAFCEIDIKKLSDEQLEGFFTLLGNGFWECLKEIRTRKI